MKNVGQILLMAVIILLASCECDETQSCEGLSAEGRRLLPTSSLGSTFENDEGDVINIFLRSSEIQEETIEDCGSSGSSNCECGDCPEKKGLTNYAITPIFSTVILRTNISAGDTYRGVFYSRDTLLIERITRDEDFYIVDINETNPSNPHYEIEFLGFSYIFDVETVNGQYSLMSNATDPNVELLPTFTTPVKTYNNILEMGREASRFVEQSEHLLKLYYSEDEGVVAYEAIDGELFYLTR